MPDTDDTGWIAPQDKKPPSAKDGDGWVSPKDARSPQEMLKRPIPEWMKDLVTGQGMAGGAVTKGASKAAPDAMATVKPLVEKGLSAAGKGVDLLGKGIRGGVDAADDMLRAASARRATSKAADAANAAPTKEKLYTAAGTAFEDAAKVGGELPPGYLSSKIIGDGTKDGMGLRDRLLAADINLADHPELYKQANDMMRVLDRKMEDGSIKSFGDLMKLERELRPYVRRAKAESLRESDASGLRAATLVRQEVGKLLQDFPDASGKLGKAKELYKRAAKMDDVEDIISKAKRTNDPTYLQKEFRDIALDDYAYKNYTPAEQKLIDEIQRDSQLENMADAVHLRGAAGAAKRIVGAARGVNDGRMKKAQELMDLIARGGETEAPGPSAIDRINKVLRPGPPNSANRSFPYSNP